MIGKYLRPVLAISVLSATAIVFWRYFATHPSVRHQLGDTSAVLIVALLCLYLGTVFALVLIFGATLRLCKLELKSSENVMLTAYSSVINFFGPLQSGPAFRAIYLRKKYGLRLGNYTSATLVYYFFYGGFSVLFLLSGLLKWWLIVALMLLVAFGYSVRGNQLVKRRLAGLDLKGWYYLMLATFLQVTLVAAIYFVELRSFAPATHLSQAIVYAGAANLALFVSLTPGAIGFRESFLLFSQNLHDISTSTIVAANILDRSIYVVLMLMLAVYIFISHTARRLDAKSLKSEQS